MTAHGNTVGQTGNSHAEGLKQAGQEHSRSVTLGIGVGGHDYLADAAIFDPLQQLVDTELIGAYVAQGRNKIIY